MAGEHLVGLSIYTAGAGLEVDRLQELAAAHLPQRVLINKGGFELKLDDADGFVHAGNEEAALAYWVVGKKTILTKVPDPIVPDEGA